MAPKTSRKLRGVVAALSHAGLHLTQDQRYVAELVVRKHPELETALFTPGEAVARLSSLGVPFTDGQIEFLSGQTSPRGVRSVSTLEEQPRGTVAARRAARPAKKEAAADAFSAWWSRTATAFRGVFARVAW